jgi:putative ABC transport system permease protein
MDNLLQDLRFGMRVLIKNLAQTLVTALALALGIGATSAVFSVANAVLIRPLPYDQPDRLMMIWENNTKEGTSFYPAAPANWVDFKNQSQLFEQIGAFTRVGQVNLTGMDEPTRVTTARVSADFFSMLGSDPILGRCFTQEEDQPGNNRVVVLSHGFWQRRFGAIHEVVGRTITLDGSDYVIVGVMPHAFSFPVEIARGVVVVNTDIDLWAPLALPPDLMNARGQHFLRLIGRLKPGVVGEQAATEMKTIGQLLAQQYPESNASLSVNLVPLQEQIFGRLRPALFLLLGVAGFVLLIACANVANLLLARGVSRKREMAVRLAVGASRLRLIRQLLTESTLLALAGGLAGIALAYLAGSVLPLAKLHTIPRLQEVRIDWQVFTFTLLLSLLTGIVFGLIPALKSSDSSLQEVLKESAQTRSAGSLVRRIQSLLVVMEISLAFTVLIGAGLMIKSYVHILGTDPGFNPNNILTAEITLPFSKYGEGYRMGEFFRQLLENVSALPGVRSSGAISHVPFGGVSFTTTFVIEGRSVQGREDEVGYRRVSSNYFATMGIPLLQGRYFSERDIKGSPEVILINEELARRYWPDESPIGKRVKLSRSSKASWLTIVGVVGAIRHFALDAEPEPEVYEHYLQNPGFLTVIVHTTENSAVMASAIRGEIWKLDKDIAVSQLKTMDQLLAESLSTRRLNTAFFAILAVIACILAGTGIYAVMSFSVTQRSHEIGVRIALGAQPRDVLKLVVMRGMMVTLIGIIVGLSASVILNRILSSLMYRVSVTDPATFLFVTLFIVGVAVLASYVPARRATRVDPIKTLRYE